MSKRSSVGLEELEQVVALLLCASAALVLLLSTSGRLPSGSLVGAQTLDHSVRRLTINFLSRLLLGLRWPIGGLVLPWRSVFAFLLLLSRRILVFFLLVIRATLDLISLLIVMILVVGSLATVALGRTAIATASAAFFAVILARGSVSAPAAALSLGAGMVLLVVLDLLPAFVLWTIFCAGTSRLLSAALWLILLLVVHRAVDIAWSDRCLIRCSHMLDAVIIFLFVALDLELLALDDLGRLIIGVYHCPVGASLRGRLLRHLCDLASASVGELGGASARRVLLVELLEELLVLLLIVLAMVIAVFLAALPLILPLRVDLCISRLRLCQCCGLVLFLSGIVLGGFTVAEFDEDFLWARVVEL